MSKEARQTSRAAAAALGESATSGRTNNNSIDQLKSALEFSARLLGMRADANPEEEGASVS